MSVDVKPLSRQAADRVGGGWFGEHLGEPVRVVCRRNCL